MFDKVNVPILGLIENMSLLCISFRRQTLRYLWKGGGEREANGCVSPCLARFRSILLATREQAIGGFQSWAKICDRP